MLFRSDYAKVGYNAKIADNETVEHTIIIAGTAHTVNWWGHDVINIGCEQHSINHWLKEFKNIGAGHNYTEAQINEYHHYIKLIAQLHKALKKQKP